MANQGFTTTLSVDETPEGVFNASSGGRKTPR